MVVGVELGRGPDNRYTAVGFRRSRCLHLHSAFEYPSAKAAIGPFFHGLSAYSATCRPTGYGGHF
jgi:hypothetical protein